MLNCCVATGCGNMPSDSVSVFHFPKDPNLCGVWTIQVQRTRAPWNSGSLPRPFQCRLLQRNSSAESNLCFAEERNRVLKSMAVPEKEATKVESGRKTCIEKGKLFCPSRQSIVTRSECTAAD